MKKTLALFGLVAISVALVVLTVVHSQNSNNGGTNPDTGSWSRIVVESRIRVGRC